MSLDLSSSVARRLEADLGGGLLAGTHEGGVSEILERIEQISVEAGDRLCTCGVLVRGRGAR